LVTASGGTGDHNRFGTWTTTRTGTGNDNSTAEWTKKQ
jgi:hypothetical protein